MKKYIFSIFLSLGLFFLISSDLQAACRVSSIHGQCARGEIICDVSGTTNCCDQAGGGCSQLPGSVQATILPNGGLPPSNSNPLCGTESIDTAIGCIPVGNTTEFMGWILGWALGIGGGISFLLIIYASFMIMTSAGAPERLKAGQELLTSAISGLILLIFSVTILKIIGIDILKLDTF